MPKSRLLAFLIKELREVVPPTVFFAVGFNLIVLTTDLILADYLVSFGSFMVATITALVVGKAVLVANAMPFLRRFDTAPMIQPVLFKTIVYWAVVFLVRFLEKLVEYLFAGGTLRANSGVRGDSLHLAPLCRYPDLDLRSLSDLHIDRRTQCATRRWRAHEDILHQAFIGNEADAAGSGFARSSGSAGESRHTPSMSLGFEANFHVSQCPSAEVCSERTMHRKPMWLIPVSIICGWRAAGR